MDFLKRIQSHSPYAKAQYSVIFAGLVTGIIALVWATTIPARFSDKTTIANHANEDSGTSLSGFLQNTKQQLGNVFTGKDTTTGISQEEIPKDTSPTETNSALSNLATESSTTEDSSLASTTNTFSATGTIPIVPKEPRTILIGTTTSQKSE